MNKVMEHVWSLICQKAVIDSNTNNLSIFEVFEKIDVNVKFEPKTDTNAKIAIPMNLEIINFWKKLSSDKNIEGEGKIIMYSPENKELMTAPLKFSFTPNIKFMRTITKLNMLPITTSGEYKVEVQEKVGKEHIVVAEIPFEVVIHHDTN